MPPKKSCDKTKIGLLSTTEMHSVAHLLGVVEESECQDFKKRLFFGLTDLIDFFACLPQVGHVILACSQTLLRKHVMRQMSLAKAVTAHQMS